RLASVRDLVAARRGLTLSILARAARAIACSVLARLAVVAGDALATAAIHVRLRSLLFSVGAVRRLTSPYETDALFAIGVETTSSEEHARLWTNAAAIDVGLEAVLHAVVAS